MAPVTEPGTPSRLRWWMGWALAGAIVVVGDILALRLGTRLTPLLDVTRSAGGSSGRRAARPRRATNPHFV